MVPRYLQKPTYYQYELIHKKMDVIENPINGQISLETLNKNVVLNPLFKKGILFVTKQNR